LAAEDELAATFPPINLRQYTGKEEPSILTSPAVVVDRHDRILCWYLPGILTQKRTVSLSIWLHHSIQIPVGGNHSMHEVRRKIVEFTEKGWQDWESTMEI
jgi:hypothetical protein